MIVTTAVTGRDGIARLEAPLGKVEVLMGEAIEEVWIVVDEEN
jgi:hypothetical protein